VGSREQLHRIGCLMGFRWAFDALHLDPSGPTESHIRWTWVPGGLRSRLVKSQCTCSSGFSRVASVTVGPCFKRDRSLVALAAVSNHGYPSKMAHLFHADVQRVRAQRLRLAIRSRCRHGGFDCVMQKRAGIESLTDHANRPERHLTHAGRKWAEQHRRRCASID